MNLIIQLDGNSKIPMYEQLYLYIKRNIMDGNFSTGERLPSTRVLAQSLGVSRNTIDRCYEQLRAEGYIEAVVGSGFNVCKVEGILQLEERKENHNALEPNSQSVLMEQNESYQCDFSLGGIDEESFPLDAMRRVSRQATMRLGDLLRSGNAFGEEKLREEIARYLKGARGVACDKKQIVIGAGNDYLLMLLTRILNRESIVAMEYPTYTQAYHVLKEAKCRIVPIPLDSNGVSVEKLRKTQANLVYVMPSHQFPMGTVMSMSRRMELLKWAYEKKDRYIIEDDYDSELRYKGKPIPALQGNDNGERVIYLGTFSQSIAPSIRVSYMVLPKRLLTKYYEECGVYSNTVSRLQQEIVWQFMAEGYFERHLNRMRKRYKYKRDLLLKELGKTERSESIYGSDAGTHILLLLENGKREEDICARAAELGVHVKGIHTYTSGGLEGLEDSIPQMLVLSYGGLSKEQIQYGANVIRKIIK